MQNRLRQIKVQVKNFEEFCMIECDNLNNTIILLHSNNPLKLYIC